MATTRYIGLRAVQEFNLAAVGQTQADDEDFVLRTLKDILDTWHLKGFLVPGFETHLLTIPAPAEVSYVLGPGGDIDVTTIPSRLDSVTYQVKGYPYRFFPLTKLDLKGFQEVGSTIDGYPWAYYYEVGATSATLHFSSKPLEGDRIKVYYPRFVYPAGDLTPEDDITLPLGYDRYLYLTLALAMANPWGVVDGRVQRAQREQRMLEKTIARLNRKSPRAFVDPAVRPRPGNMLTRRYSWWR